MTYADRTSRVLREPFTARALRELAFCGCGIVFAFAVVTVPYGLFVAVRATVGRSWSADAASSAPAVALLLGVALTVVLGPRVGRGLGAGHRTLARRLLGDPVPAPPRRRSGGWWPGATLADGVGWRALGYSLLKVPLAIPELYGVFCWLVGLANVTYPFWWGLFRNHPPGVELSPLPVLTPLGMFHIRTFAGTFAALAAGAAMVLAAPWLARGASALDRMAVRALLGPGRLAQRVEQLQRSRSRAVDDANATLRQLERDLHDGAQIRLATLALHLGMAVEKLDPDPAQARELVTMAHREAKVALAELRDLVRGVHPPVLDNGLADALATLASAGAMPTTLTVDLPTRPTPAVEAIAYFCTAELLANAAKHSRATHITVDVTGPDESVVVRVSDNGIGGARLGPGSGLTGLAERVTTVDGHLDIHSPDGGPTRVTVRLPRQP